VVRVGRARIELAPFALKGRCTPMCYRPPTLDRSQSSFHWEPHNPHTPVVGLCGVEPPSLAASRLQRESPSEDEPQTQKRRKPLGFPGGFPWISLWFCRPSADPPPGWRTCACSDESRHNRRSSRTYARRLFRANRMTGLGATWTLTQLKSHAHTCSSSDRLSNFESGHCDQNWRCDDARARPAIMKSARVVLIVRQTRWPQEASRAD